jgi:hypothetical protein
MCPRWAKSGRSPPAPTPTSASVLHCGHITRPATKHRLCGAEHNRAGYLDCAAQPGDCSAPSGRGGRGDEPGGQQTTDEDPGQSCVAHDCCTAFMPGICPAQCAKPQAAAPQQKPLREKLPAAAGQMRPGPRCQKVPAARNKTRRRTVLCTHPCSRAALRGCWTYKRRSAEPRGLASVALFWATGRDGWVRLTLVSTIGSRAPGELTAGGVN